MFFIGHMTWAYIFSKTVAGKHRLVVPIVLILAVIPDVDLLLGSLGVLHHTLTHSILFWLIASAPFLMIFRIRTLPYIVAIMQHFTFGDLIVGNVMIFWPFSQSYLGFNTYLATTADVALEAAGLILAMGISYFNRDLRYLFSANVNNFVMLLPFMAVLLSMLRLAGNQPIEPLVTYISSNRLLTATVLLHIVLLVSLAFSTLQGLRSLIKKPS